MVGDGRTIVGQIHDAVSVGMCSFARFGFEQGINRQVDPIADAVDDVEIVDRELVVHQRNRNRIARACNLAEQTRGPFQPIAQLRAINPDRHKRVGIGAEVRHVADLSPYPNALVAVRVNGAQLRNWLERAAGLFSQIASPGNSVPVPLVNNQFPIYNFDVIHGIRYKIDLSVDPLFEPETGKSAHANRHRILDLTYNGAPVTDHMEFIVATNSYRAGGGGSFPDIAQADVAMRTDTTTNEAIASYLSLDTPHDDPFEPVWSFAPLNGARVVFETGPKARNRLEPEFLPEMRDLGDNSAGFALFELTL